MSTSTSQDLHCPRCGAHVRAGSDWCTLCYTDLRPSPPEPDPPAVQVEAGLGEPAQDGAAGSEPVAGRPRGKHARRDAAGDEAAGEQLDAVAEALLAELAATESGDPLGRFAGQVGSPGRKAALMVGGAVALTAVLFLLMVVLGALL